MAAPLCPSSGYQVQNVGAREGAAPALRAAHCLVGETGTHVRNSAGEGVTPSRAGSFPRGKSWVWRQAGAGVEQAEAAPVSSSPKARRPPSLSNSESCLEDSTEAGRDDMGSPPELYNWDIWIPNHWLLLWGN